MIKINLPFLPPSSNHAYTNNGFGGRVLSKVGTKFKNETTIYIARNHTTDIKKLDADMPLVILATFYIKTITNEGWPKKAKRKYKKLDVTNRVKLLEDAVATALAVDDANTLSFIPVKRAGTPERVTLCIWSVEKEECPIYDLLQRYG